MTKQPKRYRSRCWLPALDGVGYCSYVAISATVEGMEDAWREHVAAVHGYDWLRDPWAWHEQVAGEHGHDWLRQWAARVTEREG
jgi:hypothetical protein